MLRPIVLLHIAVLASASLCFSQTEPSRRRLTGVLLASDQRCDKGTEGGLKDEQNCLEGSFQWGLLTRTKQYFVRGDAKELRQFERRRVTVTGIASPGSDNYLDIFDVRLIGPSEMPDVRIRYLIAELRHNPWAEPANQFSPTSWVFNFTSPMLEILQAGPSAQETLLKYLDDPEIKDQVIVLLGGVGDRRAVGPIIDAMAVASEARTSAYAKKVNLAANLALTNITVSDVIWHHGGGITSDRCPDDPKSCWQSWWDQNSKTFDVAKTVSRNYSNYPSYGIYQNPGVFRSESFR